MRTNPKHALIWASIVVLSGAVGTAAGCGSKDENPDRHSAPTGERPEVGPLPDTWATTDTCTPLGEVVECTVELGEVNGVKSCFIGLQVCEADADGGDPTWSECTDPSTIEEKLLAMQSSGVLPPP